MRAREASDQEADHAWPAIMTRSVEMSDAGLVVGARSLLARMTKSGDGAPRLAIDTDRDRCLTMLSVAWRRPVGTDIFRHVEAASNYWQRGDKALANLRLVFAGLPRLAEPADGYRLCLAEHLLDEGMAPDALMKELGFRGEANLTCTFDPEELRVPPGHSHESGRWTRGSIVVAANDGPPHDAVHFVVPHPVGIDQDNTQEVPRPINPLDFFGGVRPGGPPAGGVSPASALRLGGRLGNAATRALNAQIGAHLEGQGYDITGGAGSLQEEYIRGAGPGTRGSTYVDITAQDPRTGNVVRVQTIDTLVGCGPVPRESAAATRIRTSFPNDTLHLVRKR